MINRILVPRDARLAADATPESTRRRTTSLDARTVVAADLPAIQLDARTNIPAYMPIDVIPARMIIPRDMPVVGLDLTHTLPSYVPLEVLGEHVAVPKDAKLPQTEPVAHPLMRAYEMPDVLEPDVMTTGEVNLLTGPPRNLRDEAKWVLRGTSVLLHAVALVIILLIPALFPSHQPTQAENIAAMHSLGDLYIPPDMRSIVHPAPHAAPKGPPIHIDPKIIRQLAPSEATPPPGAFQPPPVPRDVPKDNVNVPPTAPVTEQPKPQPVKPPPAPQLEPLNHDPPPGGLILPKFSAGHAIQQSLADTSRSAGAGVPSVAAQGRMPGGKGGGYGSGGAGGQGGGQANAGLTMLTPSEGIDWNSYMARVVASVKRNWYAIMPESALMGDQGIVLLRFKIYQDGSVVSEDPVLERSSGKTPLDRAAMSSIRASSPFEPLPPEYQGREAHDARGVYAEFRFMYFYNLPISAAQ